MWQPLEKGETALNSYTVFSAGQLFVGLREAGLTLYHVPRGQGNGAGGRRGRPRGPDAGKGSLGHRLVSISIAPDTFTRHCTTSNRVNVFIKARGQGVSWSLRLLDKEE